MEEHKLEKVSPASVHRNASNSKVLKLQTTSNGTGWGDGDGGGVFFF